MRGGTSRGPFFLESDLPAETAARDRVLLAVMGVVEASGAHFAQLPPPVPSA